MKKMLFTPGISGVEALGTITRLLAVADEIRKIDSDTKIVFRAEGIEAAYAREHQYEVVGGYPAYIMGLPKFIGTLAKKWGFCGPIPDIPSMNQVIRLKGMLPYSYVKNTFEDQLRLLEKLQPDCIIGEFDLVMPIAARKLGMKYYSTGQTPGLKNFYSEIFPEKDQNKAEGAFNYNRVLGKAGLPKIEKVREMFCEYYGTGIFVPSIPELEEFPDDPRYIYVGSLIPENFARREFTWDKKRPLIYVYLSHSQVAPQHYEKELIEAFASSEYDVIVTGGGNPYFKKKGEYTVGNVHFFNVISSDQVMKFADLAIHHGGQNSTVQAIINEVPALIYPGRHFERYFNAKKAAQIGCAYNLPISSFHKVELIAKVKQILNDSKMKEDLATYSAKILSLGGKRRVAETILQA